MNGSQCQQNYGAMLQKSSAWHAFTRANKSTQKNDEDVKGSEHKKNGVMVKWWIVDAKQTCAYEKWI